MRQQVATQRIPSRKTRGIFELGPSARLYFDVLSTACGPRIAAMFNGVAEPGLDKCFLDPLLSRKYAIESFFRQKDLQGCDWIITDHYGNDAGIFHLYYVHESRGKKICTIGYALSPAFRRLGFANEALQHVLTWLERNGFSEVKAVTGKDNHSSVALLRKNLFEPAVRLKERKTKWVTWRRKLHGMTG